MAVVPAATGSTYVGRDVKVSDDPIVSTTSVDEVESPTDTSPGVVSGSETGVRPSRGILDNAHEAPRRASRASSGSSSGFRAALKASFLLPPIAGKQIKLAEGQRLGKSFKRSEPLPDGGKNFEGGEVLLYDPRGDEAGAGDGFVPSELLRFSPSQLRSWRMSASDSGYISDYGSSADGDVVDLTSEYAALQGSSSPKDGSPGDERGRRLESQATRTRQGSVASTASSSSNSGAAIRFCPLPTTGRLKRANSITIGVAARAHLLQSQGTAAPPRQYYVPQHIHSSQAWYNDSQHPDVIDVGEEIRKGALKAWKKIRGSGSSSSSEAKTGIEASTKKQYQKESAPVTNPKMGDLKVVGGAPVERLRPQRLASLSEEGEPPSAKGDQTPRRATSPDGYMAQLAIHDASGETTTDPAAAMEAATERNAELPKSLPGAHHPHELEDGPQHDSYHLADAHDDEVAADDGMRTPQSKMQRRSSTGAFLHGLSLKGIQEARRRELLGLDEDAAADRRETADGGSIGVRGLSGKVERVGLAGDGHY